MTGGDAQGTLPLRGGRGRGPDRREPGGRVENPRQPELPLPTSARPPLADSDDPSTPDDALYTDDTMTQTLAHAMRRFGDEVMADPTAERISTLWEKEYAWLSEGKSRSTMNQYASRYRRALQRRGVDLALRGLVAVPEPDAEAPKPLSRAERIDRFIAYLEESALHGDIISRKWHEEVEKLRALGLTDIRGQSVHYRAALKERDADHPALPYITTRASGEDIEDSLTPFVARAMEFKTKKALEEAWKVELAGLTAAHTAHTARKYVTFYRNAIREAYEDWPEDGPELGLPLESMLGIVRLQKRTTNKLNHAYKKDVATQHRNLVAFPTWEQVVDIAAATIRQDEADEASKYVSLALLTGRRTFELGVLGTLSEAKINGRRSNGFVQFVGQAKGRDAEDAKDDFLIPVLTDARTVIRRHNELRALGTYEDMDNKTFNTRTAHLFKRRLISLFGREWPTAAKAQVKMLRALYAEICYHTERDLPDTGRMTKQAYFAQILGHASDDIETANSYYVFDLS